VQGLQAQQLNTDIYCITLNTGENGLSSSEPLNITNRKGYDNQPCFSNNGKRIYYSANYSGTNDIYCYDIESGKNLTITNTPATSEFSPMETPDGRSITAVFIEKDTVTQRLWNINLRTRKQKVFGANHDSIGYYWPIDYERGTDGGLVVGTGIGVRTVTSMEYDVAVYVLGKKDGESTLRIIDPFRKPRPEKILDDSIGRCIRQVTGKHTLTYVKKTTKGNYLKFYDLWQRKVVAEYFLGKENEDYCWKGTTLLYTDETMIKTVSFEKGFDQPKDMGSLELVSYGIKNMKRISCYGNQVAFVADDK
jgi:hypothetical protein